MNRDLVPATPEAYRLFHEGALAFSRIEHEGMRIDLGYLDRTIAETDQRISRLEERLRECDEFALQRKQFGQNTNPTSREQLASVLFGEMEFPCHSRTATGKFQLDEAALERIGTRYCKGFLKLEKLNKLRGTYLEGLRREVEQDGFMHAGFNLHTVRTFRGSGSDPNFQNIPIRNEKIAKIIRRAFIPRDGHALVYLDYGQIEVRVACCLSGDEKLTYDTLHGDMHRDMAAECFLLDQQDVSKPIRGAAKGGFVFAEFYGDWYKQVAKNLWGALEEKTVSGVQLEDHLNAQGIVELGECDPKGKTQPGTFESHIQKVEDRFWNERFQVYHKWRQNRVKQYKQDGWFDLVTGFVCQGIYSKNQIINFPIQGPAFHCLLWSLIRLVKEMRKRKMRSKVIGQIHDSIVADVHRAEVDDYVELATRITVEEIRRHWTWITVPLEIDVEVAEDNWFEKVPYAKMNQASKPICVACGDTGRNSRGGVCVPCLRRKEAGK